MSIPQDTRDQSASRREFLKQSSGVLAGAALASAISARAYAGEDNTIKLALVGCGGRGTGAAENALSTQGPTRLVAMADAFDDRLQASLRHLSKKFPQQVDVPKERQFLGIEGFTKAIDAIAPGGVALLATPPAFRPLHVEHAVNKGCHVFMEKAFAVDAPGVRRILKAGQEAQTKNLKIAGGLMSRHSKPLEGAVEQLHQGLIGNLITSWAYRVHGPVPFSNKRPGENELAHQIRNFHCFTWLNGSFLLDWLIHNLDVCCWCKDAWPVSAQGQGGRQVRPNPDQLFDHYAVEYHFPDGTRLFAQGRHMDNCWGFFGDVIHGAKGSAVLGEGVSNPRIFKGYAQRPGDIIWQYKGPPCNQYQVEHDRLFEAIRQDKPYNEAERSAYATLVGILGRMAAESGQLITWNEALTSNLDLAPGLDHYTMDSNPPVLPDDKGNYPVAVPGTTKVL
ncbi:MAG: Gfo/Idh/MocA family oxidoreductase [Planctomycetes bacterium]|nr:Gfo/Idh/MocA family oxidoreductase [Planctomycetota bacterium]